MLMFAGNVSGDAGPSIELNNTASIFERQPSDIYDKINDPDETYSGLKGSDVQRNNDIAHYYAKLVNDGGDVYENDCLRPTDDVYGVVDENEYLQLINEPIIEVHDVDDSEERDQ